MWWAFARKHRWVSGGRGVWCLVFDAFDFHHAHHLFGFLLCVCDNIHQQQLRRSLGSFEFGEYHCEDQRITYGLLVHHRRIVLQTSDAEKILAIISSNWASVTDTIILHLHNQFSTVFSRRHNYRSARHRPMAFISGRNSFMFRDFIRLSDVDPWAETLLLFIHHSSPESSIESDRKRIEIIGRQVQHITCSLPSNSNSLQ